MANSQYEKSGCFPSRAFFLLMFVFLIQVVPNLFGNSDCGEEARDLTDGYFYWSGDVISEPTHAPLSKGLFSLPIRLEGAYVRMHDKSLSTTGRVFFFLKVWNKDRFERWLWEARGVALLFGIGLGAVIAWGVRRRPKPVQWAALTLWAFEPTLLGFSVVAQSDIALAFFYGAAVLVWVEGRGRPWKAWTFGVLMGAAACMKYTGVMLMPVFIVLELLEARKQRTPLRFVLFEFFRVLLGAFAVVCLVYGNATLKIPGHPMPWKLFLSGMMSLTTADWYPAYFLGAVRQQHTFWYFPVAWVLKSGLAYLILLGLAVWIVPRRNLPAWMWLPAFLFLLTFVHAPNMGVRYLLPCAPFLIWVAAEGFGCLWEGAMGVPVKFSRALGLALLLGQVASTALAFPNHIGYFNDLVPKSERKYLLGDSNTDFGQDKGRLARRLEAEGLHQVKVSYFGGLPVILYGRLPELWPVQDAERPEPGYSYALGMEYEQLGPAYSEDAKKIVHGWVTRVPPDFWVGDNWRVWINPHEKLYGREGDKANPLRKPTTHFPKTGNN
jgi:hypothetical protein